MFPPISSTKCRLTIDRTRRQCSLLNFAFAYGCNLDYFVLNDVDIGRMDKIWNKCQATKWKAEAPGLCCSGGNVDIPKVPEPTSVLKELISDSHPSSKHFLNDSRQYNTLFQMTSFVPKKFDRGTLCSILKCMGKFII